jgi:hypothetical protein
MRETGLVVGALVAAGLLSWLSGFVARKAARRQRGGEFFLKLHKECHRAWTVTLFVLALLIAVPKPQEVHHALVLGLIGALAWLAVNGTSLAGKRCQSHGPARQSSQ